MEKEIEEALNSALSEKGSFTVKKAGWSGSMKVYAVDYREKNTDLCRTMEVGMFHDSEPAMAVITVRRMLGEEY